MLKLEIFLCKLLILSNVKFSHCTRKPFDWLEYDLVKNPKQVFLMFRLNLKNDDCVIMYRGELLVCIG